MVQSCDIIDLLPAAGAVLFILTLVGYIASTSYNNGYYKFALRPSLHKNSMEYTLTQVSRSLIAIGALLLLLMFISYFVLRDTNFNATLVPILMIIAFLEGIFFISYLLGAYKRFKLNKSIFPLIEINTNSNVTKTVRLIYELDETFFYCLNESNGWSMIRKDSVLSIEGKDDSNGAAANNITNTQSMTKMKIKNKHLDNNIEKSDNTNVTNAIMVNVTLIAFMISAGQYFISENESIFKTNYPNILADFYIMSAIFFIIIYILVELPYLEVPKRLQYIAKNYFLLNLFTACIVVLISKYVGYVENSIYFSTLIQLLILSISTNLGIPITFIIGIITYNAIRLIDFDKINNIISEQKLNLNRGFIIISCILIAIIVYIQI
ncbi:hypothetical protein [Methanolobus psychrotolerans]|uniref:hypothetical protein n=1 Tax=Methanolobus psychrotolerans TaxID=1874706 RepID=UPI000B9181C6|nr:hypothetical protein [Methanolobus psychrotolerans]